MATSQQARQLATRLPQVEDGSDGEALTFTVAGKGFAWTLLERDAPKAPRRPVPGVLAVACDIARKEMLIEAAPETFFQTDHYRGYPAVLVRLEAVSEEELAGLLKDAWLRKAPKALAKMLG
jgi:hypothetical protein